jgi:L-malate glycosyltransferase
LLIFIYSYGVPTKKYPLNGIFAFDYAHMLKNEGHEVCLLYSDLRSIRRLRPFGFKNYTQEGLNIIGVSIPIGGFSKNLLDFIDKIVFKIIYTNALETYGIPDIIHSHFLRQTLSIVANISIINGAKLVATLHDGHLMNSMKEKDIEQLSLLFKYTEKVYVPSQKLRDILVSYGYNTYVSRLIVDPVFFDSQINIEIEKKYILSASRLDSIKGMDVLLKAWGKSNLKHKYELRILGDGPERVNLIKLINELDINDTVSLCGRYTKIEFAQQLEKSVFFVMASRSESFGLVFAEALATGNPVIATLCGGPEELINESNGILVPIDNPNTLAHAMEKMDSEIHRYNRFSIRGEICQLYSSSYLANSILSDYESIIRVKV